jgi:hypothetical protein
MADDTQEQRSGPYVEAPGEEDVHLLKGNEKLASERGGGGGFLSAFPNSIKYLVWNEFCERFSFYGMKTILALYLVQQLRLSENESTELVHLFIVACYATPLLGAFISDCYWVSSSETIFFPFITPFVDLHILERKGKFFLHILSLGVISQTRNAGVSIFFLF